MAQKLPVLQEGLLHFILPGHQRAVNFKSCPTQTLPRFKPWCGRKEKKYLRTVININKYLLHFSPTGQQMALLSKLSRVSTLVNYLITPELVLSICQDLTNRSDMSNKGKHLSNRTHQHLATFERMSGGLGSQSRAPVPKKSFPDNPLKVIRAARDTVRTSSDLAMQH